MSKGLSARLASALIAVLFLGITVVVALPPPEPSYQGATVLGSFTADANVTVTDNAGRLMNLAEVRIVGGSGSWLTNDEGFVQIPGLYANDTDPGTSYNFTASKSGYRSTVTQFWLLSNQTNNITLVVEGGTILGIVTSHGDPISGANVSISALKSYNITGSDGRYQLSGIPWGTHDVTASKTGYDNKTETVTFASGDLYWRDFSIDQQTGSISGFVKSDAGAWLIGANVTIRVGLSTITVPSNDTGFYNLDNLPEGTYSLTASLNGFYSNTTTNIPVTRGDRTENINFTLFQKPSRLYGVVKAGTLLLPGVNISVVGTSLYNISDYEGAYQLVNMTAGTYNISASLPGYVTNITEVVVPAGSDIQLLINLREMPGSQVMVRVTATDTGAALVGVLITISGENIEPQTQSTNIDGKFAFTGLAPGNYTLQLVKEGYQPIEITKRIWAGENETLVFTMEPLRKGDTGFIFGFDMAHSMMILALFLTIVILAMAVWLRIKTFQTPESAPAVYDEEPEEQEEKAEGEQPANEVDNNGKKNGQ